MTLKFEELKILQAWEYIADEFWKDINHWEPFVRDVVGKQQTRSTDSIGANIAEAYSRFHYGEKIQFLYYARGSLFESKYWLNRLKERNLMVEEQVGEYSLQLSDLACQLNSFISDLKAQQNNIRLNEKTLREETNKFNPNQENGSSTPLFEDEDLQWLEKI
jgi:four helix bundle protein